jgi:hypothetical protein
MVIRKACRLNWPSPKLRRENGLWRENRAFVAISNPQAQFANPRGSWPIWSARNPAENVWLGIDWSSGSNRDPTFSVLQAAWKPSSEVERDVAPRSGLTASPAQTGLSYRSGLSVPARAKAIGLFASRIPGMRISVDSETDVIRHSVPCSATLNSADRVV